MTMAPHPHLLKSFDAALQVLRQSFQQIGTMAVENCVLATSAYLANDEASALEAVNLDLDVDRAFEQLRADCFDVLLRFQPVAKDLRLVMGIEHAVGDLERAGDHAKAIARHVIAPQKRNLAPEDRDRLQEMSALVAHSLKSSVSAMTEHSTETAKEVLSADLRIDAYRDAVFDASIVALQRDAAHAHDHIGRLLVAAALERIGDHATNIAEEVLFVSRGVSPGATRTGSGLG